MFKRQGAVCYAAEGTVCQENSSRQGGLYAKQLGDRMLSSWGTVCQAAGGPYVKQLGELKLAC